MLSASRTIVLLMDQVDLCFWFLGVNFLPQFLHSRMRRRPSVFVCRAPLLTVRVALQFGHVTGLPLAM